MLNLLPTAPTPRLGGMQAQLLTRIESEAKRRPVALLYPEAEGLPAGGRRRAAAGWRSRSPAGRRRRRWRCATPPSSARWRAPPPRWGPAPCTSRGWPRIPLGSLAELQRSGLALVLSVHDFSLFCPRPHLLEQPQLRFCDYSRDRERCARCLAQDWPVGLRFQEERREIARELLLAAAAVVYPSEFLRRPAPGALPRPAARNASG